MDVHGDNEINRERDNSELDKIKERLDTLEVCVDQLAVTMKQMLDLIEILDNRTDPFKHPYKGD